MPKIVAVDQQLTHIREYLREQGFKIVSPQENSDEAELIVLSGLDPNYLGDQSRKTKQPVLNAQGLTAQEVGQEVQRLLQPKQGGDAHDPQDRR